MIARIALVALIASLALAACVSSGGVTDPTGPTATYGAEQFRAQLTAQAEDR